MRGDVSNSGNGLEQRLSLAPNGRGLDGLADIPIELGELLFQEGDVAAKPPGQLLVHGLIAAVGLHVDHPDDLLPPAHELGEVASLRFRQRPDRWSDAFGKEGDHLGVERVGLRQPAHRSGEVADLARVDDAERQPGCGERCSDVCLVAASGFQDDEGNREAGEAARESFKPLRVPRNMEGLVQRPEMNVETVFGHVDADEDGGLFVHDPTLQMRARARAAARVRDCGGEGRTLLCRGLESPRRTRADPHRVTSLAWRQQATSRYKTVRRAIQARQESVRAAAKRYGISPTTVQKWRSRPTSTDARMGPKGPHSTVLSLEHEAVIVAFRRNTLLPLDDCLYALQPSIPHPARSSLHRCLQKAYPIGYFHIDIAQVSTEQGKLHLFVAIDRTSKFVFVQLHEKATQRIAAAFLRDLVAAVPYTIHTVLTDNGIQFTDNKPVNAEAEAKVAAY